MGFRTSGKIPRTDADTDGLYTNIGAFRFDMPDRFYLRMDTYYSREKYLEEEDPIDCDEILGSTLEVFGEKSKINMVNIYQAARALFPKFSSSEDVLEGESPST